MEYASCIQFPDLVAAVSKVESVQRVPSQNVLEAVAVKTETDRTVDNNYERAIKNIKSISQPLIHKYWQNENTATSASLSMTKLSQSRPTDLSVQYDAL